MEIVKKEISLNPYISREHSLIPYIGFDVDDSNILNINSMPDGGNWGKYPYDIDLEKCGPIEYIEDGKETTFNPLTLSKYFTTGNRVAFRELVDKYILFSKILRESVYYRSIWKNGKLTWLKYEPSYKERLDIRVKQALNDTPKVEDEKWGVYSDNSYIDNGDRKMAIFLFKAMGMFVVDDRYISPNNAVPEIMCYGAIEEYIKNMDKYKNGDECCANTEFQFLGGDDFYTYLKLKSSLITVEKKYWFKAVYKETTNTIFGKAPSPYINLSVALNAECLNIGTYTAVYDDVNEQKKGTPTVGEITSVSKLRELRRTKMTYYTDVVTKESLLFPLILDDVGDNQFYLSEPYTIGYPKNLVQHGEHYYGDMIYHTQKYDDNTIGYYYVVGGELYPTDGKWYQKNKFGGKEEEIIRHVDEAMLSKTNIENFFHDTSKISYNNVEVYLRLKYLINDIENYPSTVEYGGEITSPILVSSINDKLTTYKVAVPFEHNSVKCEIGDFIIVDNSGKTKVFNTSVFNDNDVANWDGVIYYEVLPFTPYSLNDIRYTINMLVNGFVKEVNILSSKYITNENFPLALVDIKEDNENVYGVFLKNSEQKIESCPVIMKPHDFGRVEFVVENASDVVIDRGFVSTFELHYKLGEINSLEDMENYQNNTFLL